MSEENKEIVRRFAEALNNKDLGAFDEFLTPDFVRHCQATPDLQIKSREEFKEYYQGVDSVYPDQWMTLEIIVAEGDKVATWGRFTGTQKGPMGPFPATGKKTDLEIATIFRIQDGKIAELWVLWDNVASLVQLGHMPAP
jgi:steroid delta-isomerase-like uncharacterized protein